MQRTGQKSHAKSWSSNSGLPGSSGLGLHCSSPLPPTTTGTSKGGSQKEVNGLFGHRLEEAKRRGQLAGPLGRTQKAAPTLLSHQASPGLCLEGCYPPGAMAGGNPQGAFPLAFAFPCPHHPPPSAKKAGKQSRWTGTGRSDFNSNTFSATLDLQSF